MKLSLGTVAFGVPYGISNSSGQVNTSEVLKILSQALKADVQVIDTASQYGESEKVLGRFEELSKFKVVTKTGASCENIEENFHKSLELLGLESTYGLLVHDSSKFLGQRNNAYSKLIDLKERGLVKKIGFSVYSPIELEKLLEKYPIDLVQIPLSLFDQRFIEDDFLKKVKKLGIEIHTRSLFLQGLGFLQVDKLPEYFTPIKDKIRLVQDGFVQKSFSFIKKVEEVDHVVIGVQSKEQLIQNLNDYQANYIEDFSKFAINDEKYINPANWKI